MTLDDIGRAAAHEIACKSAFSAEETAPQAAEGEVLVSGNVRNLVAGSRIELGAINAQGDPLSVASMSFEFNLPLQTLRESFVLATRRRARGDVQGACRSSAKTRQRRTSTEFEPKRPLVGSGWNVLRRPKFRIVETGRSAPKAREAPRPTRGHG